MKVREIMRAPRAILSPETSVTEALARLHECGVPSLPVANGDGYLLGVVTLADLAQPQPEARGTPSETIRQRLSPHLVAATPEMDVSRLAEMMRYKGFENIMVLEGRLLVGALTLDEATRAAEVASSLPASRQRDETGGITERHSTGGRKEVARSRGV